MVRVVGGRRSMVAIFLFPEWLNNLCVGGRRGGEERGRWVVGRC